MFPFLKLSFNLLSVTMYIFIAFGPILAVRSHHMFQTIVIEILMFFCQWEGGDSIGLIFPEGDPKSDSIYVSFYS